MSNTITVIESIVNKSPNPSGLSLSGLKPKEFADVIKAMIADDYGILDDFAIHLSEDGELVPSVLRFFFGDETQPIYSVICASLVTYEPFEWKFNEVLAEILDDLEIHEDDPGVMDHGLHEKVSR